MQGIVFNIKHFAVHDGPGIRQTVFLKGCPLRCSWCHNPESQAFHPTQIYKEKRLENITITQKEEVGYTVSTDELLQTILKDRMFFEESNGGVTFSGGEPLAQPLFLQQMLKLCKQEEIHTAIDTTGYCTPSIFKQIAPLNKLFLYDLKLASDTTHRYHTGVGLETIVENLYWLDREKADVQIRFPMIPRITDTPQNIKKLEKILLKLKHISCIDILPYHSLSEEKQKRLGIKNTLPRTQPPSQESIAALKYTFESLGFSVKVGG